jgi:tRNA modification GTPase
VIVLVVDARQGITAADQAIAGRLPARLPRVIVHNKIDLANMRPKTVTEETVVTEGATHQSVPGAGAAGEVAAQTVTQHDSVIQIWLSAKTGEGADLLRRALLAIAGWQEGIEDAPLARERHLDALRRTAGRLADAERVVGDTELFAEELRLAQRELAAVTGEFTADDLLGEIFSRFCIGK